MSEIEIKDGYVIDMGPSLVDRVALALFNHDMSRFTSQQRLVEWTEQDLIPEHGSADIYRASARVAIGVMQNDLLEYAKSFPFEDVRRPVLEELWQRNEART